MIAGGFDTLGQYLLTVLHSGRGGFSSINGQRVARDVTPVFPGGGVVLGVGPLKGVAVRVHEINYATGVLGFTLAAKGLLLLYSEGILSISATVGRAP
jgi:hypothetical protein